MEKAVVAGVSAGNVPDTLNHLAVGQALATDNGERGARLSMLLVRPDGLWRRRREVALGYSSFMPSDRLSADDRRGNHLRIP